MRFTSLRKYTVAAAAAVLPALPIALCLAFRLVEAWKIWDEMSRLTLAGVIAWLWAVAFLAAAVITIFRLASRRNLRRWECLIDAANTVMSGFLALECADQHPAILHGFSYGWQVAILFVVFLIPQLRVTFAAQQARDVASRLRLRPRPKQPATPPARAILIMRMAPCTPAQDQRDQIRYTQKTAETVDG